MESISLSAKSDVKTTAIIRAAKLVLGNHIETLDDLTDDQLLFFSSLPTTQLNQSLAMQELLNGSPFRKVERKYGIGKGQLHRMLVEGN